MPAPAYLGELDLHLSGTTWEPIRIDYPETEDLAGATARMQWRDAAGTVVLDWDTVDHVADGAPNNGYIEIDSDNGHIWLHGPGVLMADEGRLEGDLKLWLASGEVAIDIRMVQPIEEANTV